MSNDYGDRNSEREVVPGVLRGYRTWQFDGTHLVACNFDGVRWLPGRNEAVCMRDEDCKCIHCDRVRKERGTVARQTHLAPQGDCTCGFYAKHKPGGYDTRGTFIGIIKAYGKVILGTLGFRAQYAEIEALAIHHVIGRLSGLAQYEVPIFADPRVMVEQFPPIPVTELLPKEDEVDMSEMHSIAVSAWTPQAMAVSMPLTQAQWNKMWESLFPNGNV